MAKLLRLASFSLFEAPRTKVIPSKMYDVVAIGETMLRLSPPDSLRIEQASQMLLHVGGSESNTAAGLSRLGHRVAWLSRLTDNALGRKIAAAIAAHGVDTRHVIWTDQDRIGTYYYEPGSPPRDSHVIYDRGLSSYSRFSAEMLPEDLFRSNQSRFLHITGISLGLGATSQAMIARSVKLAREVGWKVSFDVNYRAKLWSSSEAAEHCRPYLAGSDLVFLPIRDARTLFGAGKTLDQLQAHPERAAHGVLESLAKQSAAACIVLTLGRHGAAAWSQGQFYYCSTTPVEPVGRLGGGDAFSAGFLSCWLETGRADLSLRRGNAAARLKYSIPGDLPFFDRQEVLRLETPSDQEPQHFR